MLDTCPIPIHGGLPLATDDLRWIENFPLYIVGSLGALNTGSGAGNLMGIRRAARLVAHSLDCRCGVSEKEQDNLYEVLLLGDSSGEDDTTDDDDSSDEDD